MKSVTKKQEIYLEILEMVLPYIRNIESQSFLKRIRIGSKYDECELVHNMHRLLLNPEFDMHDINWINHQLFGYMVSKKSFLKDYMREKTKELFSIMPLYIYADIKNDLKSTINEN